MKLVKPQHFLPVHGEYAFLCAHAELAREIGIQVRVSHFLYDCVCHPQCQLLGVALGPS